MAGEKARFALNVKVNWSQSLKILMIKNRPALRKVELRVFRN
jgi:hypothetical protein